MNDHRMVLGLFRDHRVAQNCVDALYERGYTPDHINVLMSETTRSRIYSKSDEQKHVAEESMTLEGIGVGGAIGTAVGASLAALAAVGTSLVIPGLNVVLAGPIVAALAGGGAGAVTGGLIGAFAGFGIPAENAEAYHKALREGGTIVGVTLQDSPDFNAEAAQVKKLMSAFGGEQVHSCYC